jgi:hypothetical protein
MCSANQQGFCKFAIKTLVGSLAALLSRAIGKQGGTTVKQYLPIHQILVIAFVVIGTIALSAIFSNYAGSVQVRIGSDGIHLEMDGSK